MKLHEVLEIIGDDTSKWFRPAGFKGSRHAFCVTRGQTLSVPSPMGGFSFMYSDVQVLKGDWEIVTADDVLDGN